MPRRKKPFRDFPGKEAEQERLLQNKRFKYSMEDENERDIEEDSVAGSDIETDSEDLNNVEGLSCDSTGNFLTPYDHYLKVLKRTLPDPVCDEDMVVLSWNDSDLNMVIDEKTFSAACPLHWKGFCYLQGGVRATHGFTGGRVCFEVKIISLCNIKFLDGHLNTHLIRVGWSPYSASLALGSDRKSYGYDSNGRASTKGEIKDYGKTLSDGDVIGAYLDLNEKPITISFTVNGEDQGIAYTIPHFELNNEALFPHILSKNIAFECNFGSECTWFTPKKGYTFVDDMPLKERVPGPRYPKNQADCEVIMMIGLPRSGKTTWAREFCARNPGKYYVIDVMNLVDKMEIMDPVRKAMYLRKSHVLGKLFHIAVTRCRNYILDQVNASRFEWQWKMRLFKHFQRRAIVSVIPDDEFERRIKKDPLDKGHDWLMLLKARISLPQPSYLLNRIDYVGLPYIEAEKLFKRYNREAWEKGYMPHKHFVIPSYIFQNKNKKNPYSWKSNVGKGRIADPVGGPSRSGRLSPHRNTTNMQMSSLRKEQLDDATTFVPGGKHNESSLKQFQGDLRTRNPHFQGGIDHPRRRRLTPELDPNSRWSPARNIADWPPGRTLTQRASSLSPPRNVSLGRGFVPQDRGRKGFYESASRQDPRHVQSEVHGGWRPPNRGFNRDFSPPRGGVGGGRQVNEFVEQGSPEFSQMHERKMLDCAGPQEGRAELGFQSLNRPASFSPNRRGSVQYDPEFEKFHPQRRVSGQLSQNFRHGDGFPPSRDMGRGEERDSAPRQRMADGFPSHDSRGSNVGFQRMGGQISETFPAPEERIYNRCSPPRKRESGDFNVLEDRRGRFPERRESRQELPLQERYQEDRSEFPSLEDRQSHSYSPLKDQRRSRGQGRGIPFNEQRMSLQDVTPGRGRGDSPASYRENRMGDEPIHLGERMSSEDLPIHRERVLLPPGDKQSGDMYSNVPDTHPQGGRLFDGSRSFARNKGRDHPASDGLAHGSRGIGNLPKRESGLESNLHPHRSRSLSPHREERPGGWLPSEVGHFGGNQPVKPEISDWNRTRQANREIPDRMGYPDRDERPPEDKWGRQSSPAMDQLWDSKCLLNKDEKRTHGDLLNRPIKLEHVGDGDITSYSGMSDVLNNRFEDDKKNLQSMVKRENWKGASSHSNDWQSSSEIRGDWKWGPSSISPMKELPFQNRRGNLNQHGNASRPHEFPSAEWNPPHSGPKGHSSPHRRGRWGSRSPGPREGFGREDSSDHREFPHSKSPVHSLQSHPRGSPVHHQGFSPRGSPDRGPLGSPACGSRDLPGRGIGRSPDWGARNSPSRGCRSSGPEEWGGRGSPYQFRRGSPVQYRRDSPIRGSGGFPGPGTRGSPIDHYRGSPSQDSRGPRIPGATGSPIHRSRSPVSGPLSPSGRVRRGSLNRGSIGSPDRNVRGSPIPWNKSPSSRTRMRQHLPDVDKSRSPRRAGWHSPTGRSGSNRLHGEGMNRFNKQELPSHYDMSLNVPQNIDGRGGFPYDREGNADNWLPEKFRGQSDYEINQQRFMRHHSNERMPKDFEPTSNVDVARPFVRDRLGPKLPDEDMIAPYEGGPVGGPGSWEPPGDDVGGNQSPHGSSGGGSCWERVPGSESANPEPDELAPYEQPFTQALWDSNDPQNNTLEFPRSDPLLIDDYRRNDQERPPNKENRGNVWTRVGGYVNDDNDPRGDPRRSRDPHPPQDRRGPPRSVPGSSRRGMSREREGKFFSKSTRRSPGRRPSPPERSSHWESKRHAPYPERRRTPPRGGPRSHWKSPPRKRDWRTPPRRRGLRSPPKRW